MDSEYSLEQPLSQLEIEHLKNEFIQSGQRNGALADTFKNSAGVRSARGMLSALQQLDANLYGLGPLQPLLTDASVTDILVNSPQHIYTDGAAGLQEVKARFDSESAVRELAVRLIGTGGKRLDDANPCADVMLAHMRVHAVIAPISPAGTVLSIRLAASTSYTLEQLAHKGMFPESVLEVLHAMVRSRVNFLITGPTGTGKTTLLAAMLSACLPQERMVIVEDSAELHPVHKHVVNLQSRMPNVEGAGNIGLDILVKQGLRMRPDRLIVGEVRGAEIVELLMAMNTGHQGAGASMHANSAQAVPGRLAALASLAGISLSSVNLQASSAIEVVVHISRRGPLRWLAQISTLSLRHGELNIADALSCPGPGEPVHYGPGWEQLSRRLQKQP